VHGVVEKVAAFGRPPKATISNRTAVASEISMQQQKQESTEDIGNIGAGDGI
jgi:hypothetical protein